VKDTGRGARGLRMRPVPSNVIHPRRAARVRGGGPAPGLLARQAPPAALFAVLDSEEDAATAQPLADAIRALALRAVPPSSPPRGSRVVWEPNTAAEGVGEGGTSDHPPPPTRGGGPTNPPPLPRDGFFLGKLLHEFISRSYFEKKVQKGLPPLGLMGGPTTPPSPYLRSCKTLRGS